MTRILFEPFSSDFMRRALIEVALLGILGGVVGVHVLLRRLAFMTEALQHTVFPGIAIAFVTSRSLLLGALVSAVASVVMFGLLTRARRVDSDGALAVLISTFFAVGVVIVSRGGSFQHDLTALLFGRILTVDNRQITETAVITVLAVIVVIALHKELVLRAFDPLGSEAMGYPAVRLDLVLNLVVALAVVAAVRAVGTVLLVAFLVTPAAAARLCCRRLPSMMVFAGIMAVTCGWLGLAASYEASVNYDVRVASGAAVVLCITLAFLVVAAGAALRSRLRSRRIWSPQSAGP